MSRSKTHFKVLALVAILAAGGVVVYGYKDAILGSSPEGSQRRIAYYQDSMHPQIKSDRPGKCTICGMDLTPIYEGDRGFSPAANVVVLNPTSVSVLNVKTAEVRQEPLRRIFRVSGTIDADEARKVVVSAPAASRIDVLNVTYTGMEVQAAQPLVTIFSPELVQKGRVLRAAALNLSPANSGIANNNALPAASTANPFAAELTAPLAGTVIERPVSVGQFVAEGEKLLTIVDTSVLWFRFDVYERQLPWFQLGQRVNVVTPGLPGKVFPATIEFIEPTVNESTRSVKVRATLRNPLTEVNGQPQRLLKLGMYAQGYVLGETPDVLAVPRSAILQPGERAYVYVDQGDGAYEMRPVVLGRRGDESCEVLQGLDAGDRVVINGNVLIDAQAQFAQSDSATMELALAETRTDVPAELPEPTEPAAEDMPAPPVGHDMATMADMADASPTTLPAMADELPPVENRPRTRVEKTTAFMAERDRYWAMRQAALAKANGMEIPDATLLTPSGTTVQLAAATDENGATTRPSYRQQDATRRQMVAEMQKKRRAAMAQTTSAPTTRTAATRPTYAQQDAARREVVAEMQKERQAAMAAGATTQSAASTKPTYTQQDATRRKTVAEMKKQRNAAMATGAVAFSEPQRQAFKDFVIVSAAISEALAADNLPQFNESIAKLPATAANLKKEMADSPRWETLVQNVSTNAADGSPAADLADARKRFLPLSTATVELVKQLRADDSTFAGLKVYHCPMAPKPGLWIQAKGPLCNPYFGAEMPHCGNEVK